MKKKDLLKRIENLEVRLSMLEARTPLITYTETYPTVSPYFSPNTCEACKNGGICNCTLNTPTTIC